MPSVAMITAYCLVGVGISWLIWLGFRAPRLKITCVPIREPYRHEWDDTGGHQILFRIAVENLSETKGVPRAEIRVSNMKPSIQYVPCNLLPMNEKPEVKEVSLPPRTPKYFDLFQQNHPNGNLYLWDTVTWSPKKIPSTDYVLTISVSGDGAKSKSQNFELIREGSVWVLLATD